MPQEEIQALFHDEAHGRWLRFSHPVCVLTATRHDEVVPLLREAEERVERDGVHAAGFISYEAAPAFDPSLPTRLDDRFPLLWFGLFAETASAAGPPEPSPDAHSLDWRPSITPKEYRTGLRQIRELIRAGDTYQVNFTYRMRAETDQPPWTLFTQLVGDAAPPFAAFVDTGDWSVCSASPELFFRLEGNVIESRPMKGTAARGRWYEDDRERAAALRASAKERAENVMIVDMVRNDLGRIAHGGSVHVPALFTVEQYPSVWQMTSTVGATTHASLTDILKACFPPASITGAPKRRTMEIIAELESTPRRVYTGTVGFLGPGRRAQFNVAIRTALVHRPAGRAEYGVGGGITVDSDTESEFEESRIKAAILRPPRPRFDLLETMHWSPQHGFARLPHHLGRLAHSAAYFGFALDLNRVQLELQRTAEGLERKPHRVRLAVARTGAAECTARPLTPEDLAFGETPLAAAPVDRTNVFLYHKTTDRSVYETALRGRPGAADVLLYNEAGEVTESTIANVAFDFDGALFTPPVRCGLLPGACRAALLDTGRLQERVITVEEALRCPRAYLMNGVRGLQPVKLLR